MFETLTDRLQNILNNTMKQKKLTQENMQKALREIRRALLEADVNLRVVNSFISNIKDKAAGADIIKGVNPAQQLVKIVKDELANILGEKASALELKSKPSLIMLLGLQGTGKTTSAAKLAAKLKQEGKKPLLVACDIYRPAAIKQLELLASQIDVECFSVSDSKDVPDIIRRAKEYAAEKEYNVLILDTAGRLQIDVDMMTELLLLDKLYHPDEKLLVIDAMVGQDAVNTAENFNEQLGLTGIIITKLDGDSRGGAALSVSYCTGKPIKYTGTGENLNALETFHPDRMASRILGMGDIVSFVERAKEVVDDEDAKTFERKMHNEKFSFNDFLRVKKEINKLGPFGQVIEMLPGPKLSKEVKDLVTKESEKHLKKVEVFIQSMTEEERNNPEILNSSRKKRISAGSGISMHDINTFISQLKEVRETFKGMNRLQKKLSRCMKQGSDSQT